MIGAPAPARGLAPVPSPPATPVGEPQTPRGLAAIGLLLVIGCGVSALMTGFYEPRTFQLVTLGLLGLVVAAVSAGGLPQSAPARLAAAGLAGLAVWTAASMLWAESTDRAWTELDRVLLYAAALTVALVVTRTRADASRLMAGVAVVASGLALLVVVRLVAGQVSPFTDFRLSAPVGYINGTAGFFLMGFWPTVALAVRFRTRPGLALPAFFAGTLQVQLVVLTQSRAMVPALLVTTVFVLAAVPDRLARAVALLVTVASVAAALPWTLAVFEQRDIASATEVLTSHTVRAAGIAALIASVLGAAVWSAALALRHRSWSPTLAKVAVGLALLAIVATPFLAVSDPVGTVRDRYHQFTSLEVNERPTASRLTTAGGYRYDLWRVAWSDFRAAPLKGLGAGNYGLTYFQKRRSQESVRQPHSIELQLLAETGVVGFGLFMLVLVGAGLGLARLVRGRDPAAWATAAAASGLVVAWLVHTSVDWLWNLPGVTCLALLGVAALCAESIRPASRRARTDRLALVAVIVVTGFAAASVGRHHAALVELRDAQAALPAHPGRALRDSSASLKLNSSSVDAHVVRAAAFARFDAADAADQELVAASRLEPSNQVPWALRGDLAARRGRLADARRFYEAALRRSPRDASLAALVARSRPEPAP